MSDQPDKIAERAEPFNFFVSYRRRDTAPIALLLKHELEKRLQFVRVAVDVEDIHSGDTFPERIGHLIDQAEATIVLIGRSWMARRDQDDGKEASPAAASSKKDWVVHELVQSMASRVGDVRRAGQATRGEKVDDIPSRKRHILPIFFDIDQSFSQFNIPPEIASITALHSQRIDHASWPRSVGPLIDEIARQVGLQSRPEALTFPEPDSQKARTQPLSPQQIASVLQFNDYKGWYLDNFGTADALYLVKSFKFADFDDASKFMSIVSEHCRVLDHHPEWRNVYDQVIVSLTTWDARRKVTLYDMGLALFMNKAAHTVDPKRHPK